MGWFVMVAVQGGLALCLGLSTAGAQEASPLVGYLENPGPATTQSGVGVISGWVCEAEEVMIEINGEAQPAGYGTERMDTEEACGDVYNGFGLLFNWNRLEDGEHEIVAMVGDQELGRAMVTVKTFGQEFVEGVMGEFTLEDFPDAGSSVGIEWRQSIQNFAITDIMTGEEMDDDGDMTDEMPE